MAIRQAVFVVVLIVAAASMWLVTRRSVSEVVVAATVAAVAPASNASSSSGAQRVPHAVVTDTGTPLSPSAVRTNSTSVSPVPSTRPATAAPPSDQQQCAGERAVFDTRDEDFSWAQLPDAVRDAAAINVNALTAEERVAADQLVAKSIIEPSDALPQYIGRPAPDDPGARAREQRTVPPIPLATIALSQNDPLSGDSAGILNGSAPRDAEFRDLLKGSFAEALADAPLTPLYQATPGKAARVAVVTAWSMRRTDYRKAIEAGPASVVNKVLYCRRHGYDLYVHDTAELITNAGYEPTDIPNNRGVNSTIRPHQWAKPLSVTRLLPHYDWVVWHDADILFMNFSVTVFDIVRGASDTEVLVISYEDPGSPWYLNTGHYVARGRSNATVRLLNASWHASTRHWGPTNDQGALNHVLDEDESLRRLVKRVTPLRVMGAFVLDLYFYAPWRRYRYGDANVHLTYCSEQVGCNEAIAHLFVASLALNGLYNGTVPANVLYLPKAPPQLRPAGAFGAPLLPQQQQRSPTVLVVSLGDYWDRGAPAWLRAAAAARWRAFCERSGCGYDARGKPDLIWAWHSEQRVTPGPRARWKLLQTWLPYADWVLYVDADVAIASDQRTLQELVRGVPDGVDIVGAPSAVHPGAPAAHALLVRRSAWSLRLMESLFYAPQPALLRASRAIRDNAFARANGTDLVADTRVSWERLQLRDDLVAAPAELCQRDCALGCALDARRHWLVRLSGRVCREKSARRPGRGAFACRAAAMRLGLVNASSVSNGTTWTAAPR